MGFISDFAQGFFETSANTVLERKKQQDEIDAARKKAVALVDPQAELYQRHKDIELEYEKKKQQQANDNFLDFISKSGGAVPTPATTEIAPTISQPAVGQQAAPSGTAVNFAPAGSSPSAAPQADTLDSVHTQLQHALKMKAAAAATNNKQQEQYWDTIVEMKKSNYQYLSDSAKNASTPIAGSEGVNIVETIQKKNDKLVENEANLNPYLSGPLSKTISTSRDVFDESAMRHSSLAQAALNVMKKANPAKSTAENSAFVIDKTKNVIQNLNIVLSDDPKITDDQKRKAAEAIQKFETYVTKNDPALQDMLASDPNYAAAFDQDIIAKVNAFLPDSQDIDTTEEPAAPASSTKSDPLEAAKAAIAKGAPRDKVIQRLKEHGIDTTGL